MKVLITGSSGQIGTNLALSLLARGNQVLRPPKLYVTVVLLAL